MKNISMSLIFLLVLTLVIGISGVVNVSAAEQVSIKLFSTLPDRTAGMGKLEQLLIDNYMKENPNVEIEVEALQDEPYKQKFRVYTAGNQLPDIFTVWGQPAFFNPIMEGGYAAELDWKDYEDYDFFQGALGGFSLDGKLYGLARNTDLMLLYFNEKLFKNNGIKIPTTYEELIAAAKAFRGLGIAPNANNGRESWSLNILYQDLLIKESGDQGIMYDAINQDIKFTDNEYFLSAAKDLENLIEIGFFQDSFIAADYGAARNLFGQEMAAMYYMGSWEAGLATDEAFSESFRNNVSCIAFPGMKGEGKGKATDMMAWNGGGYAVSSNSEVKEEAIKLLNYMMKPENWTKYAWQMGLAIPAQNFEQFMTGNENRLQLQMSEILNEATSFSGTPWNDAATPGFKTDSQTIIQGFAAGILEKAEFLEACDEAAQKTK